MALTDESGNGLVMPVAPMGNGNNGFFGGDGAWIILFLIAIMFGGFNGGWGGNGFNGGLGTDFPWLLNANNNTDALVAAGFANQSTQGALNGIQSAVNGGFADTQLGIAGLNQSICQNGNMLAQQMYSNQIADLERSFAAQTAATQNSSAIQSQLAQCCCDNRLATAQTQALVQSENCADRTALNEGIRDILTATQAQTQAILTQLNNDRIEQKNDTINQLRSELMYARGQASQDVQTAAIQSGQRALTNEIENLVSPRPIPAYYVANPNGCGNTCGCGM